jgi:hypothetical protein
MQFAEEFTARRLNAYAEAERAREIELRRVIAERKALAKEQRTSSRRARRTTGVVAAPEASAPAAPVSVEAVPEPSVLPETVTVEAILASAPKAGSEVRRELDEVVR